MGSGATVARVSRSPGAEVPAQAIAAFERLSGLTVSLHDLVGAFVHVLPPVRLRHHQALCRAVKLSGGERRCVAFDVATLRHALAAQPNGLIKRCHAGLVEWAVPGHDASGGLAWVLFAGPRRDSGGVAGLIDAPGRTPADIRTLPSVDAATAGALLESLRQLAGRLAAWCQATGALPRTVRSGALASPRAVAATRRTAIATFIRERHATEVALPDLARELRLSPGRTAHAVAELCGAPFSRLLAAARLDTAALLLGHTALAVGEVALRSGFRDLSHFHAVFRRRFATTPRRYRMAHAAEV